MGREWFGASCSLPYVSNRALVTVKEPLRPRRTNRGWRRCSGPWWPRANTPPLPSPCGFLPVDLGATTTGGGSPEIAELREVLPGLGTGADFPSSRPNVARTSESRGYSPCFVARLGHCGGSDRPTSQNRVDFVPKAKRSSTRHENLDCDRAFRRPASRRREESSHSPGVPARSSSIRAVVRERR